VHLRASDVGDVVESVAEGGRRPALREAVHHRPVGVRSKYSRRQFGIVSD